MSKNAYKVFIDKWGKDAQLEKLEEELIELLHEIKRYRKGKPTTYISLLDELVDCTIMIEQALIILNIKETDFINHIEYKINRGLKTCGSSGKYEIDNLENNLPNVGVENELLAKYDKIRSKLDK